MNDWSSFTRRRFLGLVVAGSASATIASLLSACGPAAPAAGPTAVSKVQNSQSIPTAAAGQAVSQSAAPAVGQAAASPAAQAAPTVGKVEPKGRFVYGWHTTISPAWLDPQENPPQITPYNFCYAVHDALVKHLPGKVFAPSLAESYEIAPDFKSATFRLRQVIKFHDGTPVTPEDVKFTYEKYRGANAAILHEKTASIDSPDSRTVKFTFKEPFLDFLVIYGSPASGAGWIVPKAYYEKVGPNGFKQAPIGAGPYRVVKQQSGVEIEMEAFTDYWRHAPYVKTLIMRGIPEAATRLALLQTGEADVANQVTGELLDTIRRDSRLRMVPVRAGTAWLDLLDFDSPKSPLTDVRVRQALSLTIDRQAISDAEMGGMGDLNGNWIPSDWPGAVTRPEIEHNEAKARELLKAAGVGDGFEISQITPLPPYFSWAERIASQLRTVGITTKINTMERGAFYEKLAPGPNRVRGLVMPLSGAPGDAAARIRENALCDGAFSSICDPEIDDRMKRYDSSVDVQERQKLVTEVQNYILDNYLLIPVLRQALTTAVGPRLANKAEEIVGAIPQYSYMGPWEDVQITG